jgi:hypothetical protein
MRKYNLIDPKMRRTGQPAASGAPAADDGSIILCCGPHGLWPTQLISQMRCNLAGICQCRGFVCTHKVLGHTQTWVEGLAMRKVVTELNCMLPPQASTTHGQGIGTSFVLFSVIHKPDGLYDHELVVHDCLGGVDNSAQRVLERMRNTWLSDWLLSVTKPEPVREDACLFIITESPALGTSVCEEAGAGGLLSEWEGRVPAERVARALRVPAERVVRQLPSLHVERQPLLSRGTTRAFDLVCSRGRGNFRVFRSRSNRFVFNCTFRDFVPIHICHHSQPALSTRYCRVVPTWNHPVPRPLHLKIT